MILPIRIVQQDQFFQDRMALDVQLQHHNTSANPPQSDDLFGVMISFRLPKSHSSPHDLGLDASKAAAASAKQGILSFSI